MPKFSCTVRFGISSFALQADLGLKPLTAALDHAQRGEIVARDRRIGEPADEQRRHDMDVRDAMLLDQAEDGFGRGVGGEHHLRALEDEALEPGTGERQIVRDRQHVEQHAVVIDAGDRARHLGIVDIVVVRARDELRHAGGAAREKKQRGIGGIDRDARRARRGRACFSSRSGRRARRSRAAPRQARSRA